MRFPSATGVFVPRLPTPAGAPFSGGRLLILFFLEDPFALEDAGWFQHLRSQTSTPLTMGEL
jgi:hypothetical protein